MLSEHKLILAGLKLSLALSMALSMALMTGCQNESSFTELGSSTQKLIAGQPSVKPTPTPSPSPSPSIVVCDPFGGDSSRAAEKNGIKASLTYLPVEIGQASVSALTTASFSAGSPHVVSETTPLYLNQLNVRTTNFTSGFQDGNGDSLRDLDGHVLNEYFALHLESEIQVSASLAGDYQFGILSDDGSIMEITPAQGVQKSWIVNDHIHPNTLGCAADVVHLSAGKSLPIHIDYFQGPKWSIALVLLWRKNPTSLSDIACGSGQSDDYYFTASASGIPNPTGHFVDLLSRGWEVVPAEVFFLPNQEINPCSGN